MLARTWLGPGLRCWPDMVVVDTGSRDGTPDFVAASYPDAPLLQRPNRGFGAGVNGACRRPSVAVASRVGYRLRSLLSRGERRATFAAVAYLSSARSVGALLEVGVDPRASERDRPNVQAARGEELVVLDGTQYGMVRGWRTAGSAT